MEYKITELIHVDLIEIEGRIDSYSAPQVDEALKALIANDHGNFIVDMKNVSFISSSGILVFVNTQKRLLQQKRGEIVFSRMSDLVCSGFKLAGFDRLFAFYNDIDTAVNRF